jgi:hypothetical protein
LFAHQSQKFKISTKVKISTQRHRGHGEHREKVKGNEENKLYAIFTWPNVQLKMVSYLFLCELCALCASVLGLGRKVI